MATAPNVRNAPAPAVPVQPPRPRRYSESTLLVALAGSLLYWAALPPLGLSLLAFLAPVPLLVLAQRQRLTGWRPYTSLWLAGFAFWMATLYWLTLPHWATSFGWVALSFYLAFYFPALVALTRVALHGYRIPLILAAPVVWTGLEFAQAHLMTGFAMAPLSHTQFRHLMLIQISDLVGEYGVTFVIVFVAACLVRMLPIEGRRAAWWPVLPSAALLAAVLAYGWNTMEVPGRPGPKVALIQGSIDTEMKSDPTQGQRIFEEYFGLSRQALSHATDVDLVVWPETMFRETWFTFAPDFVPSKNARFTPAEVEIYSHEGVRRTVRSLGRPALFGIDVAHQTASAMERYNSALAVDEQGRVIGRYDKVHRVMFGEYVPWADRFPWLYRLTPLPGGINRGSGGAAITVRGVSYAPNICFESTLAHVIRRQLVELRRRGQEPDVLVNLTNDGWFWGSTELDLHLICGVFRAVECRKPFLVAANTGFSAWIDPSGKIVEQGPRRERGYIIARPQLYDRQSWYSRHGDWLAGVCLAGCCVLAPAGALRWWRARARRAAAAAA